MLNFGNFRLILETFVKWIETFLHRGHWVGWLKPEWVWDVIFVFSLWICSIVEKLIILSLTREIIITSWVLNKLFFAVLALEIAIIVSPFFSCKRFLFFCLRFKINFFLNLFWAPKEINPDHGGSLDSFNPRIVLVTACIVHLRSIMDLFVFSSVSLSIFGRSNGVSIGITHYEFFSVV